MTEKIDTGSMMLQSWMKLSADMWEQSVKQMAGFQEKAARPASTPKVVQNAAEHQREKQRSTAASEDAWRELIFKMVNNTFNGYLKLQRDLLEKAAGKEPHFQQELFENAAERLYSMTLESFEHELRKALRVPALGLTRLYQEKLTRALGKYEDFNKSLSQFMRLFARPFESSLAEFRKLAADPTETYHSPKELYKRWIKLLENDFMRLYKSPQYLDAMSGALSAYEEFAHARNTVYEDMLKYLPIPTNTEMDDLYKEIYQLKKRLKEFEERFRPMRSAS